MSDGSQRGKAARPRGDRRQNGSPRFPGGAAALDVASTQTGGSGAEQEGRGTCEPTASDREVKVDLQVTRDTEPWADGSCIDDAAGETQLRWALGGMAGSPPKVSDTGGEIENAQFTAWGPRKEPRRLASPSRTREAGRPAPAADVKKASKNHGSEHPCQQENVY